MGVLQQKSSFVSSVAVLDCESVNYEVVSLVQCLREGRDGGNWQGLYVVGQGLEILRSDTL